MPKQQLKIVLPIFLAILVAPLLAILVMNNGVFVFSLDDPLIHLAVAENILKGSYGINANEYSSPSSSILWPLLLAPMQVIDSKGFSPLLINFTCALLTFVIILKQLSVWFKEDFKTAAILALLFIACTNIVGVAYTGMEHSLQVLLSVAALRGAFILNQLKPEQRLPLWLPLVLMLGPLVRYENISLSIAIGLYAIYKGHWKAIFITAALTLFALILFSVFLKSVGLGFFPASVNSKSLAVLNNGSTNGFMNNIQTNISSKGVYTHLILMALLVHGSLSKTFLKDQRVMSVCLLIGSILHFVAGRYGWFARYELYMFIPVFLWVIHLHQKQVKVFIYKPFKYWGSVLLILLIFLTPYIHATLGTPTSSNNIYSQQFQMHRFINEFYQDSVAVNDIGWVSYQNDSYVLDLWGLTSSEVYLAQQNATDSKWMGELVDTHDIKLVMIYSKWFKHIPSDWVLLGTLRLKSIFIFIDRDVSFYATDASTQEKILEQLKLFTKTLPDSTEFIYAEIDAKTNTEPDAE